MTQTDTRNRGRQMALFLAKGFEGDGCWLWPGQIDKEGYGRFCRTSAHRWAYLNLVGPIPDGWHLDHLCHSTATDCPGGTCLHRSCVNPAHLEPVTPAENRRRSVTCQRVTCSHGHPWTPENIYQWVDRFGFLQQHCRRCSQAATLRYRARRSGST
jgi:hypothetical protein